MNHAAADALLRAAGGLSRWASAQADLGAPAAQVRLLALIDDSGPVRVGDLAALDHTSQPAVTRQLDRLEALGWVARAVDDVDARVRWVSVTEAGRAALEAARRARGAALERVLAQARVDEAEVRRAASLLEQLVLATRAVAGKE